MNQEIERMVQENPLLELDDNPEYQNFQAEHSSPLAESEGA
jgi:DNA-directed RNA polymerase specialized sigma54-like protein